MNHLDYFKLSNFKRFENLEVENIGQFNLIVGQNNVGKTSLLEGLLIGASSLDRVKEMVEFIISSRFALNGKSISDASIIKDVLFKSKSDTSCQYFSTSPDEIKEFKLSKHYYQTKTAEGSNKTILDLGQIFQYSRTKNFIPFSASFGYDLVELYEKNIQPKFTKVEQLESNLKLFIKDLKRIDLINKPISSVGIFEKDNDDLMPISLFGDGVNKLFRILMYMAACENEILMIDEIDTGLHYSHLKKFWTIILTAAKNYNVQLFCTTHNPDCMWYFKEALQNMLWAQEKSRIIKLTELPDKSVKAYTRDFEAFTYSLENEIEIR